MEGAKMPLVRTELKKHVCEAVSQLKYAVAMDLITTASQTQNFLDRQFVQRSIHRLIESVLFDHTIHKVLSLFIRTYHSVLQCSNIEEYFATFHRWILLDFDLSQSSSVLPCPNKLSSPVLLTCPNVLPSCDTSTVFRSSDVALSSSHVTRSVIQRLHQDSHVWDSRFRTARFLLLIRLLNQLAFVQIEVDPRVLVLLLAGLVRDSNSSTQHLQVVLLSYLIIHLGRKNCPKYTQSTSVSNSHYEYLDGELTWNELAHLYKIGVIHHFSDSISDDMFDISIKYQFRRLIRRINVNQYSTSQLIIGASNLYQVGCWIIIILTHHHYPHSLIFDCILLRGC